MAGLSAGEVFVTLSVKSGGVKPALQKATAELRTFGKSLSALSIATGTLIADGLKFAFSKIGDIAKFAFDAAKLDPKTQAETNRFAKASDALWASLSKVAASLMSMVLPALTQLVQFLTFVTDSVNQAITYFESFGAVAALQTGDIKTAVDIMWKEIQILFLQGSQILLSMWDSMAGGFISAWQSMSATLLGIISKVFTQAGDTVSGFMIGLSVISPALASQLEPLKQLGSALQQAGKASQVASTAASMAQQQNADKRRQQAEEGQKVLQQEIDALRSQVNQQSEQAVKQRDVQRAIDQAAFVGSTAKNIGSTSAFALSVEGGKSNTVFQTQKDLLKETKEQKEIAKQNLKQLELIAKGGMVFG